MKRMLIVYFIAIFLGGCLGGFTEISPTGMIEGYMRDIVTGEPIENGTVQVQEVTFVTDSSGFFPLYRKDAKNEDDAYIIPNETGDTYSLKADGYFPKLGSTRFSYGQKNLICYITPTPKYKDASNPALGYQGYLVSGTVMSSKNTVLIGANVVVNSFFSGSPFKTQTDNNGKFVVSGVAEGKVPGGKINIYVYKDGYESYSKTIDLTSDWTDDQITLKENINMKYGDIIGKVVGYKNEGCAYSMISWGQFGSESFQFNVADMFGHYTLYGIPQGKTTFSVRSPGFYSDYRGKDLITVTAGAVTIKDVQMEYISGEEL